MGVIEWLDERFKFYENFLRMKAPRHAFNPMYSLGGLTFLFFIVQAVTGVFLAIYYQPSPEYAYDSVARITYEVRYGNFVRSLHFYSAQFMVLFALLHFIRTYFTASYRKPREFTWITGILAGVLTILCGYTGYSLIFNTISVAAVRIVIGLVRDIPLIGSVLTDILQGTGSLSDLLSRYFTYHTLLLPGALFLVLALHFYLIRVHHISGPVSEGGKVEEVPFFPNLFVLEVAGIFFALGVLFIISNMFPAELGEKFNPLKPLGVGEPEWYFLSLYVFLKAGVLPLLVVLVPVLLILFFVLLPFMDKRGGRHPCNRPFYTFIGLTLTLSMAIYTYWGLITPGQSIPLGDLILSLIFVTAVSFAFSYGWHLLGGER